ncbi:MAG TPA: glycoside hydrolase domain-containing protein [Kineosporiaceae bacterium]|nr:glycoside hydrolase domain-containing protein [Kineosporiaceae bacterium]
MYALRRSRRVGFAVVATLAAGACAAAVAGTASAAAPAATKSVSYLGLRLQVPQDWPVVDLAEQPQTCVRFDRHIVYLGHPGSDQQCPDGIRGLVDALLLEPLDAVSDRTVPSPTLRVPAGQAVPSKVPATTGQLSTLALTDPGVMLSAAYSPDPAGVSRILATASVDLTAAAGSGTDGAPAGSGVRAPRPSAPSPAPDLLLPRSGVAGRVSASAATSWVEVPGTFNGNGFDACTAPSSTAMDAWLTGSTYRTIGVYVGGASRACLQPNLTADWVARQSAQGWHLLPLYVGLQAPCTTFGNRIDPARAAAQGTAAAEDAANLAYDLGMGQGSAITFDMESYPRGAACSTAVLQFLSAWTTQLHARGYRSSVYSSANGAIADLADSYNNAAYARPDQIFFARWDQVATTDDAVVPSEFWSAHQRAKQFRGGHDETYGGVRINIDSDYLDVAANSSIPLDTTPPALSFASPADGARLRGTIVVGANATDDSGISRVELYVNGWLVATSRTAPYVLTWPSGAMYSPRVVLGLRAYDRRGNVSDVNRAVMIDNVAPALTVTRAPRNKAWVGNTVSVAVNASDTGGLSRVELWINGRLAGTDTSRPYTFSVRTRGYGHTLRAQIRAVDLAGNVTTTTRTWRR